MTVPFLYAFVLYLSHVPDTLVFYFVTLYNISYGKLALFLQVISLTLALVNRQTSVNGWKWAWSLVFLIERYIFYLVHVHMYCVTRTVVGVLHGVHSSHGSSNTLRLVHCIHFLQLDTLCSSCCWIQFSS